MKIIPAPSMWPRSQPVGIIQENFVPEEFRHTFAH